MKNNGTSITIIAISGRGHISKETTKRTRSLLYLLDKIVDLFKDIENQYQEQLELPDRYYTKIKIIRKVLKQQQEMFQTGKSVP
jgi:hypothetical protein